MPPGSSAGAAFSFAGRSTSGSSSSRSIGSRVSCAAGLRWGAGVGAGSARSDTPSRSSTRTAPVGKSRRWRRKPRARIGRRGISAAHSLSVNCARYSAAPAMAGCASPNQRTSSGLRKRQPFSPTMPARSSVGITSASAISRRYAAALSAGSPPCGRSPSRSSNCRNCVFAARSPAARWRSTVARRSSKCIDSPGGVGVRYT